MAGEPGIGFWRLLGRGSLRRCPRCGSRRAFRGWFGMAERCPQCGMAFEREEGYWVGAMIIDTAVTLALFAAVFVLGMALTWPDVPWTPVFVATVAVNGIVPVVFYPIAKTVWVALDLSVRALEPAEVAAARAAVSDGEPG